MEHRCSVRKPCEFPVLLTTPNDGAVAVRARDISLGGMYVETGNLILEVNTTVTLEFIIGRQYYNFFIDALVVRRSVGCVATMFLEPSDDMIDTLRSAIYDQPRRIVQKLLPAHLDRLPSMTNNVFDGSDVRTDIISRN